MRCFTLLEYVLNNIAFALIGMGFGSAAFTVLIGMAKKEVDERRKRNQG